MIEALYKYIYRFLFIAIALSSIVFCDNENELLENNYISTSHPICKDLCLDFYFNKKPYLGLHLKISHNLLISAKTSLMNEVNNDIYSHNIYGFDLDFVNKENYVLMLSFDVNKSLYNDDSNYSWHQTSLIYLKKLNKGNLQIILDSNYDEGWSENRLNLIYGINLYKDIFFNIGFIKNLSESDDDFNSFLTFNFNI